MSGYFGHSIFPILSLSRWVRNWLTLRLYPKKAFIADGHSYLTEPLTSKEKTIIFFVHLVLLAAFAGGTIFIFLALTKLVYG